MAIAILVKSSAPLEAVTRSQAVLTFLQNSQENTSVGVFFVFDKVAC